MPRGGDARWPASNSCPSRMPTGFQWLKLSLKFTSHNARQYETRLRMAPTFCTECQTTVPDPNPNPNPIQTLTNFWTHFYTKWRFCLNNRMSSVTTTELRPQVGRLGSYRGRAGRGNSPMTAILQRVFSSPRPRYTGAHTSFGKLPCVCAVSSPWPPFWH